VLRSFEPIVGSLAVYHLAFCILFFVVTDGCRGFFLSSLERLTVTMTYCQVSAFMVNTPVVGAEDFSGSSITVSNSSGFVLTSAAGASQLAYCSNDVPSSYKI